MNCGKGEVDDGKLAWWGTRQDVEYKPVRTFQNYIKIKVRLWIGLYKATFVNK